jgi:hypothetical protein
LWIPVNEPHDIIISIKGRIWTMAGHKNQSAMRNALELEGIRGELFGTLTQDEQSQFIGGNNHTISSTLDCTGACSDFVNDFDYDWGS